LRSTYILAFIFLPTCLFSRAGSGEPGLAPKPATREALQGALGFGGLT
jgi:hypothetical protein